MPTVELTKENFEETVTDSGIALIDFRAEWCGPCRMFGPVHERAAERHRNIVFGKVDTEPQPELVGAFRIIRPHLMAVRGRFRLSAHERSPGSATWGLCALPPSRDTPRLVRA
ncbi:thioredoxin family protein [Streptomyces sp. TRM75563]|uniref:thioredoxin family protein n=1 Tax=Streptomyces sp. TRM75563 TaxID=2817418 RepID=UPI001F61D762|nr:thioredoxin family protein [Streptomyces sp. TRM75563]MCI4045955.1 thioredoxin family protein [Streptomyces sp. TRM75563]